MKKFPLEFERVDAETLRARCPHGCGWINIDENSGELSFEPDEDRGAIELDQPLDEQVFE